MNERTNALESGNTVGKGYGNLPCPKCAEPTASVSVYLPGDVGMEHVFHCHECGEDFDCDDVRDLLDAVRRWERVLNWVALMPDVEA